MPHSAELWQVNKIQLSTCFFIKVNHFHQHWCSKLPDTYAMTSSIFYMEYMGAEFMVLCLNEHCINFSVCDKIVWCAYSEFQAIFFYFQYLDN